MRVFRWAGLLVLISGSVSTAFAADAAAFDVQLLEAPVASASAVTSGSLDGQFRQWNYREARQRNAEFWLKLTATAGFDSDGTAALIVRKGRHLQTQFFLTRTGAALELRPAAELPQFRGVHDLVFALPQALAPGETLYAHFVASGRGSETLEFSVAPLDQVLARGATHARMIALAFGALLAVSLAALLLWFVLRDKLFIMYATLFSLQALYICYLSGQGFDWPLLSLAGPLTSHAWNVPAALSGAVACLFAREIADLQRFSPRVYTFMGWLAITFVVLAFSNAAQLVGLGPAIAAIGNLIFLGTAVFTLIVALLAWRRGNRAAGWFLLAWILLEAFTITTSLRLLFTDVARADYLLYYGLPLSMVAAAILIALGVADRLREQRLALSDAERRAQTDPLTGVLNRRSLIERLDAACLRAQARGLPISLLFIDLDHFKEINDTHGHLAGDACLAAIIAPIQSELRQSDVIGRYGGEEFVVVLSSADAAAAQPIAERIRDRVAALRLEGFGTPIHVTCSIGIAASDALGVWGEQLIARADAAVYAAKRAGRNRVLFAEAAAA